MRTKIITVTIEVPRTWMKRKKKNQKVQSETHLQGMGCFVRKGFVLGVECLFNCFPHSVPHRPTAASVLRTKTSPLAQMCSARRGAGHRGDWQMSPGTWLTVNLTAVSCPAHSTIQFCYKEFQNHFLLQHWQLLPSPSCLKWKLWDKTSKNRKRLCLQWSWETSCYIKRVKTLI